MIDLQLIRRRVSEGFISARRHPRFPLTIYNYTPRAQYERVWDAATRICRGLILTDDGLIAARPFPKFFNYGEPDAPPVPDEPYDIYDKVDGSLGILYRKDNEWAIATRGSFESPQATRATDILHRCYPDALRQCAGGRTYLFEIIYPENRIVVDYGQREELILLAVIDNITGLDLPLENIGFPVVMRLSGAGTDGLASLKGLGSPNQEGFVVRFASGTRFKVKFDEYLRLHRIIFGLSSKMIWQHLRDGHDPDELLDHVPDEFAAWVRCTANALHEQFTAIERLAHQAFQITRTMPFRKDQALWIQEHAPHLGGPFFRMLDGKPYRDLIWRMIEPPHERPYSVTDTE